MRRKLKKKVLAYDAAGLSVQEIAALLNCLPSYVRATRNRAGLCPKAYEFRLAQIEERLRQVRLEAKGLQAKRDRLKAAIDRRPQRGSGAQSADARA